MANLCSNVLLASGEPENVAEFLILNAQHTDFGDESNKSTEHLKKSPHKEIDCPLYDIKNQLVGERKSSDISFSALSKYLNGPAQEDWGTKWNVVNEVFNTKPDRGAWKTSAQAPVLSRLEQWGMSTAWGPPDKWLEHVAQIFPSVSLCLGHEEDGNSEYGILTACGNDFSAEDLHASSRSAPKAIDMAISHGRKSMPLHRKPNALLRAIWEDNDTLVKLALSRTSVDDVNQGIKSRWSALMHAAFSGSEKVAQALMNAGANPLHRVSLGKGHSFGMNDICLDVNVEQNPLLVQARQNIFLIALEKNQEFARQQLGSGCDGLAISMRYQMGPVIAALLPLCPLVIRDKSGNNNGCAESIVSGFSTDSVHTFLGLVSPEQLGQFSSQIITSLIESNTPGLVNGASKDKSAISTAGLLMQLYDRGLMSEDQFKMVCKEMPVKTNNGSALMIGSSLSSVIACERARRAIEEVMGIQKTLRP